MRRGKSPVIFHPEAVGQTGVIDGETIPFTVTLDPSFPATSTAPGSASYVGQNYRGPVLDFTLNGQDDGTGYTSAVYVTSGQHGSISISTGFQQTDGGFDVSFADGFVPNTAIPTAINPTDFQSSTFRVTELFSQIYYIGVIEPATAVPAPGSASLLASGLAAVMLAAALGRRTLEGVMYFREGWA